MRCAMKGIKILLLYQRLRLPRNCFPPKLSKENLKGDRPGDEILRTVKNKGKEVVRCNS